MSSTPQDSPAVTRRRLQLRRWINELHEGNQASFIASTNDGETQINQGELSGLLKSKSFGEKRARRLEVQANMPNGYLDSDAAPGEATRAESSLAPYNASNVIVARPIVVWPFKLVSYERFAAVRRSMSQRAASEMLRELDRYFDYVVTNAEAHGTPAKKTNGN